MNSSIATRGTERSVTAHQSHVDRRLAPKGLACVRGLCAAICLKTPRSVTWNAACRLECPMFLYYARR